MKAGIIGATGYAGAELVRLLSGHPKVEKLYLSSVSFEGDQIEDIYPNFFGKVSYKLLTAEKVIASSDVVFAALPHGVGEKYAAACIKKQIHFIDLSADFRFDADEAIYNAWYDGKKYQYPELHKNSVYGLPELNRERIKKLAASGSVIIGNPGCYPTGGSLGVFPALAKGLVGKGPVIIDAISGVSGGGREPARSFHYPECADSVSAYRVASHRHSPEIARNLTAMAKLTGKTAPQVIFTPHLAPLNRGILSTIYIPLSAKWCAVPENNLMPPKKTDIVKKTAEIHKLYADFYKDEPFVRVLPYDFTAATNHVRQSNYCDISVHLDINGSTLIIITAIDNMVKGASGQAIQNMNILFDLDEKAGLEAIPALF
jgi:N-acetyl-gamma-glutamyl-phosphate reductase